jgi:PP-loop superfamily ATP-utilizing enzyme
MSAALTSCLAAALATLPDRTALCVGFSGGPDSAALLRNCQRPGRTVCARCMSIMACTPTAAAGRSIAWTFARHWMFPAG